MLEVGEDFNDLELDLYLLPPFSLPLFLPFLLPSIPVQFLSFIYLSGVQHVAHVQRMAHQYFSKQNLIVLQI
jgi:hypothetical protein